MHELSCGMDILSILLTGSSQCVVPVKTLLLTRLHLHYQLSLCMTTRQLI